MARYLRITNSKCRGHQKCLRDLELSSSTSTVPAFGGQILSSPPIKTTRCRPRRVRRSSDRAGRVEFRGHAAYPAQGNGGVEAACHVILGSRDGTLGDRRYGVKAWHFRKVDRFCYHYHHYLHDCFSHFTEEHKYDTRSARPEHGHGQGRSALTFPEHQLSAKPQSPGRALPRQHHLRRPYSLARCTVRRLSLRRGI